MALWEAAQIIAARIAQRIRAITIEHTVPVITGELRKSIHVTRADLLHYIVATNKIYARAVHDGRPAIVIRPKNAKALRFNTGGKTVYAKSVRQPARKGKPFFKDAVERFTANAADEIDRIAPDVGRSIRDELVKSLRLKKVDAKGL